MISPLFRKSLYFSALHHDGQYRKAGRVPYITHPVQVAFGLCAYVQDENILAAALLHDVLEDCPEVSIEILKKEFGDTVAKLVDAVTAPIGEYKSWKEKKDIYLEKIKSAPADALMIVALDKICNLEGYTRALQNKELNLLNEFGGTPKEYAWYYAEINKILKEKMGRADILKDYQCVVDVFKKQQGL